MGGLSCNGGIWVEEEPNITETASGKGLSDPPATQNHVTPFGSNFQFASASFATKGNIGVEPKFPWYGREPIQNLVEVRFSWLSSFLVTACLSLGQDDPTTSHTHAHADADASTSGDANATSTTRRDASRYDGTTTSTPDQSSNAIPPRLPSTSSRRL